MDRVITKEEYDVLMKRFEDLAVSIAVNAPQDKNDPVYIEIKVIANLIEGYENIYHKIEQPSFIDIIKLRLEERNLTQKKLAEILGISTSQVSEFLNGKSEPSLKIAREIAKKLDIDADLVPRNGDKTTQNSYFSENG